MFSVFQRNFTFPDSLRQTWLEIQNEEKFQ